MRKSRIISLVFALVLSLCVFCGVLAGCASGPVTVELNKETVSVYVGDTQSVSAKVENAKEGYEVEWTSSNEAVATVSKGKIKGVSDGTATITATVENVSASCTVTVTTRRTMTISQASAILNLDEDEHTVTLTAVCSDNGEVTWSSSDVSVATVENGVVTAVAKGNATITASRDEASATCEITVIQPSAPYDLTSGNNASVVSNPGVWYYFTKGADAERHEKTQATYANGKVTLAFNFIDEGMEYYFRYQPMEEVGTAYKATFTINLSEAGTVRIQNQDYTLEAGENVLEINGTVDATYPFTIRPLIYGGTAAEPHPITIEIYDFVVEAV